MARLVLGVALAVAGVLACSRPPAHRVVAAGSEGAAALPPSSPSLSREEPGLTRSSDTPIPSPSAGRNRLGTEKSPYLLQHKDNPVWWYPWGAEAFEAARREQKPIFLSVGYSTCHWCHVMERECFEDSEVARALNEGFIAIKVDREERPDVDDIYMTAVQTMTGQGGWPMSVWLTPEGQPFLGGTYFPKPRFLETLGAVDRAWRSDRGRIEEVGAHLTEALSKARAAERGGALDASALVEFFRSSQATFDAVHGGDRGAPKFPGASSLRLLLRIHRRTGALAPLAMVRTTLDAMARGGIFDHVGGGFHRYSTDARWLVPHFEKMLYDQASLASAYTEAWQATGQREHELVAREVLDYVLRDMTHPEGGFYSAEDADSEGEEGKFYVWTEAELRGLLPPEEFETLATAYGVTARGNFENGTNIFTLQPGHARATRPAALSRALAKLFEARTRRVRPHLDDKILASWNGLMIAAMARAGAAFDEPRYVEGARRAVAFVLQHLTGPDGRLLRRFRDGEARFPAYVDDYAFLIEGLIEIYQCDFDPHWLDEAVRLQALQDERYGDPAEGGYWFTDGSDATLLRRGKDFLDNVRPAGNSVAALNHLRLSGLVGEPARADAAAKIFSAASGTVSRAPRGFPHLLLALDYALDRSKEIAIVGNPLDAATAALLAAVRAGFNPNKVVAASPAAGQEVPGARRAALLAGKPEKKGHPTAYVCEHGDCRLPTHSPEEARRLANEMILYSLPGQ